MTDQQTLDALNAHQPGFIAMLGGKVIDLDPEAQSLTFEFNVSTDFCHSGNIVQGGFTTAMLDAAMSHAVFAMLGRENIVNVSSLEIKTSYIAPTLAGKHRAVGKIVKSTYKTAFLEAALYNPEGELTATASSVAKLVRAKSA